MSTKLTVTERRLNACVKIKERLHIWLTCGAHLPGCQEEEPALTAELNQRVMQEQERIFRLKKKITREKYAAQLNAEYRAAKLTEGSAAK